MYKKKIGEVIRTLFQEHRSVIGIVVTTVVIKTGNIILAYF